MQDLNKEKEQENKLPQFLKDSVIATISKFGIQLQIADTDIIGNIELSKAIFEITSGRRKNKC